LAKYADLFANFKVVCRVIRRLLILVGALCFVPWQASLALETALAQAIRAEIQSLAATGELVTVGVRIRSVDLLSRVYEQRGFAPAWHRPERVDQLLGAFRSSSEHGLNPADYRVSDIAETRRLFLTGDEPSASEQAAFDLMLTDGLVQLVSHLAYGKLDPKTRAAVEGFERLPDGRDAAAVIGALIDADDLVVALASIQPRDRNYERLKMGLAQYRRLAEAGGWPRVPDGPTIQPAADDPRLGALARRLAVSGDLFENDIEVVAAVYSPLLLDAVRRFQARHGLAPDGLVGRATLRALNVPVERRIDQIRVNLERARWPLGGQAGDHIRINVAAYEMSVIRDGEAVSTKKVIVGETEKQTPLFESMLNSIVFNPTWTVPYSIASEEMLPKIRRDPGYLQKGGYQLFGNDGNVVDPRTVDWSAIHRRNFPFTIVQQPGPANQLGQVKFLFPNEHSVCMHDTPAKPLFSEAVRAFSHGCIRVDEPVALAEILLGEDGWTRAQVEAEVRSGVTRAVSLSDPLPVAIVYRTAEVDEQGEIHFYEDIYERDGAVLRALDAAL
jgi:murein L,D-transpeptidase YcbB/YkuD